MKRKLDNKPNENKKRCVIDDNEIELKVEKNELKYTYEEKMDQPIKFIKEFEKTKIGDMIKLSNELNLQIYNLYYGVGIKCNYNIVTIDADGKNINNNCNAIVRDLLRSSITMKLRIHDQKLVNEFNKFKNEIQESICEKKMEEIEKLKKEKYLFLYKIHVNI